MSSRSSKSNIRTTSLPKTLKRCACSTLTSRCGSKVSRSTSTAPPPSVRRTLQTRLRLIAYRRQRDSPRSRPTSWEFGGHWKFANYFAGQTDPDDVATLEFDINKCAKLQHFDMATYATSGKSTKLGSLRDTNLGANAPIWSVEA